MPSDDVRCLSCQEPCEMPESRFLHLCVFCGLGVHVHYAKADEVKHDEIRQQVFTHFGYAPEAP